MPLVEFSAEARCSQYAFIERFKGRVREELLNLEEFGSFREAQVLTEAWRVEHNTYRPHSSLGGLTPAEYAEQHTISRPGLQ